ncbi:MAG: hypothetical protein LBU90_07075 [Bacteroidales bacterium]|jgi:hypothetical protein|nr:hypothetical protein [Bacteroidales bacterium]
MKTRYFLAEFFTVKNCRKFLLFFCTILFVGVSGVSGQVTFSNPNSCSLVGSVVTCGASSYQEILPSAWNKGSVNIKVNGTDVAQSGWTYTNCTWLNWGACQIENNTSSGQNPVSYYVVVNPTAKTVEFTTTKPVCGGVITTSSTALSNFSTCPTAASASQSFTVSGTGLTAAITVSAPPAGYEISANGTTWSTNALTFNQTSGSASGTVYVRLASGGTAGTKSGNLIISSTTAGTANQTVSLNGTVLAGATITLNPTSLTGLGYSLGGNSTAKTVAVTASCLTGNVSIAAPADFEVSTNGTTWGNSTTLTSAGGTLYVRLKSGLAQGTYSGNVTVASTGVSTKNIAVSGDVTITPRDFYYTGTGDWNNPANWYKSCGNTGAANKWNAVPNAWDNVVLCGGSDVTISSTTSVTRTGNFLIAGNGNSATQNTNPAKLKVIGELHLPNGFNMKTGQLTIDPTGLLDVTGIFTFKTADNADWGNQQPVIIDNKGTIELANGSFTMNKNTNSADNTNMGAYFSNSGNFNISNSDFEIKDGPGVFFYNENQGIVHINNPVGNTKKVTITGLIGIDENCTSTVSDYYCNGTLDPHTTPCMDKSPTNDNVKEHMIAQLDIPYVPWNGGNDNKILEGTHSRIFFNAGSQFIVENTNVELTTEGSSRTNTIAGKIFVRDANLRLYSSQGGLRFKVKTGGGIYVHSPNNISDMGRLLIDGNGGGSQVWVEEGGQVFSRGFEGDSKGSGCHAMNIEEGGHGFIGDIAATATDQFKIHVLDGGTLYYCGNKEHPMGDQIGFIFDGGKLHYANDFYAAHPSQATGEDNPLMHIGSCDGATINPELHAAGIHTCQDFYLLGGAQAQQVLQIQWSTTEACQADFDKSVTVGNITFLPVELTIFTAERTGTHVNLAWTTQSETDNDYFTVQRSSDGVSFHNVGEVTGAGTTSTAQHYTFIDNAPLAGVSYYRLRQTDFNGKSHYSAVVPVLFYAAHTSFEIRYTTLYGITRFECSFADAAHSNTVSIHSVTGKLLYETTVKAGDPDYAVELTLPAGVYLVSNISNGIKTVRKVLLSH